MIDSSGGNIFFLVPFTDTSDLKVFFKMMEGDDGEYNHEHALLRNNIKDWGLSHPTLEEVFLKLTNRAADEKEHKRRASQSFKRLH